MDKYIDFHKIPLNKKRVKIDIGLSYNAPHAQIWFANDNNNDDLYIFGFEPNPYNVKSILNKNIINRHQYVIENKYIDINHFCLIDVALSNVKEMKEIDFYCTKNDSGTSSLYCPNSNLPDEIKEIIKVPVYSLKHFFDIFDWDRFPYIEYIKIDAQGSDLDILIGAEDYLKNRVVYITAEPENTQYDNSEHNNFNNINKYLESQDFLLINHPNTEDPTFINKNFLYLKDKIYIAQIA
jgi:FkbM family methyltransferase